MEGFHLPRMLITILHVQNAVRRKRVRFAMNGMRAIGKIFELTEKKRECDSIRKGNCLRKRKQTACLKVFSDILMTDETLDLHEEPTPGLSVPLVSMSCDTTLKPRHCLSELYANYEFTGPVATEVLLCCIAKDFGVPVFILSDDICPKPEVVPLSSSILRVSDLLASPDPLLSCTAAVLSLEGNLVIEGEAKVVSVDIAAHDAASLQGPC